MVKECEVFQTSLLKIPLKPWNVSVVKACAVFQTSLLESSMKVLYAGHGKEVRCLSDFFTEKFWQSSA